MEFVCNIGQLFVRTDELYMCSIRDDAEMRTQSSVIRPSSLLDYTRVATELSIPLISASINEGDSQTSTKSFQVLLKFLAQLLYSLIIAPLVVEQAQLVTLGIVILRPKLTLLAQIRRSTIT